MAKSRNMIRFLAGILLLFAACCSEAFSQYEQKLTINGSLTHTYPDMLEEFTQYSNGYGLDGGLQFNFSRSFSFYAAARFYYMFGGDYEEAYYDNLAIGSGFRLNMLPSKKISPYLFAEVNINFIWFEEWIYGSGGDSGFYDSDFGTSIGGLGGLGIDFRLNENFSLFGQSGAYYTLWDGRVNLYSQVGIRINMIKSKTI